MSKTLRYRLQVNHSPIEIQFDATSDRGYLATIDEQQYEIQAIRLDPHHIYAQINGVGVHCFVVQDNQNTEVSIDGYRYRVTNADLRHYSSTRGQSNAGDLTPPMPSTVARISVNSGQIVEKGCELLVLSAMKMEIPIYAPYTGMIDQICVREGDQVMPGQQLLYITNTL
jgi:biotin carboxyl carrier protein